jgi:hypothetical protein
MDAGKKNVMFVICSIQSMVDSTHQSNPFRSPSSLRTGPWTREISAEDNTQSLAYKVRALARQVTRKKKKKED